MGENKPKKFNPRNTGKKHSPETLEKMRQAKLGKPRSEETKEKMRQALQGRTTGPCSEERRAAISAAKKGKPATPAMLKALEKATIANRGRVPWNKGKKLPPLSEEQRQKIADGNRGKHTMSHENKAKISADNMGRAFSEEHRAKISDATTQRWTRGEIAAFRSKTEIRVGWLLEPFGFVPQYRISGYKHPYDYGHAERKIVVEVQGCYWHAHGCGVKMIRTDVHAQDACHATAAQEAGYLFVTLWQCQERDWPLLLKNVGVL